MVNFPVVVLTFMYLLFYLGGKKPQTQKTSGLKTFPNSASKRH